MQATLVKMCQFQQIVPMEEGPVFLPENICINVVSDLPHRSRLEPDVHIGILSKQTPTWMLAII